VAIVAVERGMRAAALDGKTVVVLSGVAILREPRTRTAASGDV